MTEGSAGSTAISLATVAPAYGCRCHVVIPDDASIEKVQIHYMIIKIMTSSNKIKLVLFGGLDLSSSRSFYVLQSQILEALGATVERVRPVSITHKDHFVNIARRRALEANELASECSADCKGGFFADQFENLANFRAHYEGTGPEIWEQVGGELDAFVAAAGTGGTLAGVSQFLKVGFT